MPASAFQASQNPDQVPARLIPRPSGQANSMRPNIQPSIASSRGPGTFIPGSPGQHEPSATASHRTSEYGSKRGPEDRSPSQPGSVGETRTEKVLARLHCTSPCCPPRDRCMHHVNAKSTTSPAANQRIVASSSVPKYEIRPAVLVSGRPMATADTPRRPLPGPLCCHPRRRHRPRMAGCLVSHFVKSHRRTNVMKRSCPARMDA
jgi:hypothetical protein